MLEFLMGLIVLLLLIAISLLLGILISIFYKVPFEGACVAFGMLHLIVIAFIMTYCYYIGGGIFNFLNM